MVAAKLVDLVAINILSNGTGALSLGTAVEGYRGAEVLENGAVYSYAIQQGANYEFGTATYLSSSSQMLRSPIASSNGGTPINLQPGAYVALVALSSSIYGPIEVLNPLTGTTVPDISMGQIGQVYFYYGAGGVTFYGPKMSTGWGTGIPLVGPQGPNGVAANTFVGIAALKAADLTQFKSANLVQDASVPDGPFYWMPGDYTGQADDVNIIQSNNAAITVGAWVRQPASAMLFDGRTVDTKLRETVSVMDKRFGGGAKADGVTDDTAAIQAAITYIKASGGTLHFPGGTYLVSTVTFDGSNYSVDTSAGVVFKQKPGVVSATPFVIHILTAQHLRIGLLNVVGNISTDSGENNHGVSLSRCQDVHIEGVFGTNIRGDALYCYARTGSGEDQAGCFVGSVSGTNVFRNLLSVVGGQVHVGSVINAGPVGYRDFDVEPNNAGGTYEAVDLQIDYARVGAAEITSDDAAVINHSVRIGVLDADLARVQATTPPYPSAPGAGAYALGVSRADTVQIGHFRARNYNLYVLSLGASWSNVDIGTFDVANCSLTDTTYNCMILQQGDAGTGRLRIGTLICDAANTKFLARVANTGLLKIEVASIAKMKSLIGVQLTGRFANGTIDINSSTAVALANSSNLVFENVTTANYSGATFTSGCSNLTALNSSLFGSTADGINMVVGGAVRVAGTKVVGSQQGLIGDVPTGGSATASNNATGINAILAALRAHGLIAT